MGFIDQAKQYFKTRLKPTQGQFWQTFDWLRWKDEPIPMNNVDQLIETLQGKADVGTSGAYKPIGVEFTGNGYFDIPAGLIFDMMMMTPGNTEVSPMVGYSDGSGEIYNGDPIPANEDYPISVVKSCRTTTRVFVTNITAPIVFLIYTRTLSYEPVI